MKALFPSSVCNVGTEIKRMQFPATFGRTKLHKYGGKNSFIDQCVPATLICVQSTVKQEGLPLVSVLGYCDNMMIKTITV